MLAGRRVLVTGAGGFIGRAVADAVLRQNPAELVTVGRTPRPGDPRHVPLDLRDADAVRAFCAGRPFDVVFHVAGKIDHAVGAEVYREQYGLHLDATFNLAYALDREALTRFVHVGSAYEYGNAPGPHDPAATVERPSGAYGASKLASSQFVLALQNSEEFPAVVARPYLVYGPGMAEKSFLGAAWRAAREGSTFPTTLGEQLRDLVHVDKVADDLIALASEGEAGRVYNIGTGVPMSLRDVLGLLKRLYPAFDPQLGALPYRPTDLMAVYGVPFRALPPAEAWGQLEGFLRS